jgi:glycosyltransferase involved in cell wall biosynthesis
LSRILFLSYDGMTDPLGQSQVLPYLVGLSRSGYDITLVSFEKPERSTEGRTAIEQLCHANKIHWHPMAYSRKPPVLSTLKDLFLLRRHVQKLHQENSFDALHCRSYITALIGQWMKRRFGVKWIFDMRGFWADERVDGKIWDLKNPLYRWVYRFFKKKERQFIEEADHIISLTDQARSIIHSWTIVPGQPVPITVIPCCVDLRHFDPASVAVSAKLSLRHKLNIPDTSRVISYVGSIGSWYMLPEMMGFFVRWLLKFPDSIFLFISQDDPVIILQEAIKQGVSPDKIRISGAIRPDMPTYISISDCSVFFIKPVFSKKASSPTKQGEIMAMGVPAICNSGVGDTDSVIRAWNSGLLVDQFTSTSYDQVINDFQKAHFDTHAMRNGAVAFFSLDEGVNRYKTVYERVLSGR